MVSNGFFNAPKRLVWRHVIGPVFPSVRDTLVKLRILRHDFRQNWHIGWLASGRSVAELADHLRGKGFEKYKIAWIDADEILGMRKLDGFPYQYHVRVFSDGEIRGHYEKTPEAHPIKHFKEETFEPRTEEFLAILSGFLEAREIPTPIEFLPRPAAFQTRDNGADRYMAPRYTR